MLHVTIGRLTPSMCVSVYVWMQVISLKPVAGIGLNANDAVRPLSSLRSGMDDQSTEHGVA